jgi:hypothetical protein
MNQRNVFKDLIVQCANGALMMHVPKINSENAVLSFFDGMAEGVGLGSLQ